MGNFCNPKTQKIKELSEAIGKSVALTDIYVNQWQGEGTTDNPRDSRYPTPEELKEYIKYKKPSVDTSKVNSSQNSNYTRLRQIYNSTILNYRVNDIAQEFSKQVNKALRSELRKAQSYYNLAIQKGDKEAAQKALDKINEYNSPEGRQSIIRDLTLKKIFDNIKKHYQECAEEDWTEDYGKEKGTYIHNEYLKILDNFDALVEEACNTISKREFFNVKLSYITDSGGQRVLDGNLEKTDSEQFAEDEDNDDNEDGNKVTANGWDFKVRFVDPYTTQSNAIRNIISTIKKVNYKGQFVTDDLGNIQTLNSEWVDQCLRSGMKDMIDSEDFNVKDSNDEWQFPALEAMLPKYPWVSQIIEELRKKPELLGGFYSNYRQDHIHYAGQAVNDSGVVVPIDFNKPVAEESLFNETYNNYKEAYRLDDLSVYNTDGTLNVSNAAKGESIISNNNMYPSIREEEIDIDYQVPRISQVLRMLGFNIDNDYIERLLNTETGVQSITKVLEDARSIFAGIKDVKGEIDLIDNFKQYYTDIAQILGTVGEGETVTSFRDTTTKKDRNSYSGPNYMGTIIKQIKRDGQDFLTREFGQDSWFIKDGKWRSGWLRLFQNDASIRANLAIKEVPSMLGVGYTDWKSSDLKLGLLREYYAIKEDSKLQHNYGWFITPIPADAPVANFVKMKRVTGDFKKQLTPLLRGVVEQELDRIKLCKVREKLNIQKIQNFDYGRGKEFCFFPMFSKPNFMKEFTSVYNKWAGYKDMKLEDAYESLNNVDKREFLNNAITYSMDKGFQEYMNMSDDLKIDISRHFSQIGLLEGTKTVEEVNAAVNNRLEEYYWNQAYATTQMTELFVTDLAYFKDETDFQKRFKQCYATGMKLNTLTEYGKESRNNVYIKDQIITSSVYLDLKQALDEAIADGRIMDYDRDNILYKFRDVNVADAQAWITPETMRSVLDMMGKWDKNTMNQALERFEKGEWDMSDFDVIWQTIKPFMYTQIQKPDGAGGWLRVPHQNKNSEYLILAAFNTIAAATKGSSKLKAIHEFMRANKIDSIQMESAVKCGGQGIIELNYDYNKLNNAITDEIRTAAIKALGESKYNKTNDFGIFKAGNDYLLDNGKISQEEYNKRFQDIEMTTDEIMSTLQNNVFLADGKTFNPEVVHTIPYRDYMIQQPTPQHLIDEEGIFGSQLRNIVLADLPDNFSITIDGHTYNKEEYIKACQGCIVANVLQSFNKVNSRFANIDNLQGMLLDQVRSNSSKYGNDMINALQIVSTIKDGKEVKTFKIPFSHPAISQRMQELMTSAYKNQVTKQYIKGGNAILVSSWGKTDKLKLEYETDSNGKKRLAAIQCYLPASSRKFYKPFLKQITKEGKTYHELDVKKLKEAGLDKIIGYRIPTENKYSIAPLKIMGFLPQQNGSAIMLPAEITTIAGSDFDIDKMFLMIPEFEGLPRLDRKKLKTKLLQNEEFNKFVKENKINLDIIFDEIENGNIEFSEGSVEMDIYDYYIRNKEAFTRVSTDNGIKKIQYDYSKSIEENSRAQRNNHLIDLMWDMLTSQPLSAEVTSPGNFDTIKLHDRLSQIYTDPQALQEFKTTFNLTSDAQVIDFIDNLANSRKVGNEAALDAVNDFLKNYKKRFNTGRDPLSPSTFIYNHRQNMTSGKLIGIYANNTSMHLKYQHSPIMFKLPFKINGRTINTLDLEFSATGELITKNCAEFQAASVDGVKDPVLATLLQNEDTAKITGLMLRAGLSIAEISYFFNQPSVRSLIEEEGNLNHFLKYNGYNTKQGWQAVLETVSTTDLTSKMLLSNIVSEKKDSYNVETANRFMAYFIWAADYLNDITNISRADSPNGAISNTLGGAIVQTRKVDWIHNNSRDKYYPFVLSEGVPSNNYVPSYDLFMQNPISTLQAFYTCGIGAALDSLSKYYPQLNHSTKEMLQFLIDNANLDFLRYSDSATRTIDEFFKGFVQFALNKTTLFGNDDSMTLEQKRDYYLTEFPSEFIRIKNSNEEIGGLGIIKKITFDKGRLMLERSGRLRQFTRDLYMKDLDSLATMGEEGKDLAYKMFMYSFYADGFYFGPNSFGNFFSTEFVSNFNEVVDTLRNLETLLDDKALYKRFLLQFASDHPTMFPRISSKPKYEIVRGGEGEENVIYVPPQISINKTSYQGDYEFVTYDRGNGDVRLYMLSQKGEVGTGDASKYVEIPMYGTYGVYNPNHDLEELESFRPPIKVTQPNQSEDDVPDMQYSDMSDMPETFNIPTQVMQQSQVSKFPIQTHNGFWSREEAANNPKTLYVFTDNTDRDSGSKPIPDDSWYSKKYGTGHHYPSMTAAVIRGLDNARPISTQRWYHDGAKGNSGRWTDANVVEFEKVLRDELQEIVREFNTGRYDTIMFPSGDGLFNAQISDISMSRTPKLYQTLVNLLREFGFNSLVPTNSQVIQQSRPVQQQTGMPEQSAASTIADLDDLRKSNTDNDMGAINDVLKSVYSPEESNEINDFELCKELINKISK